MTPQGRPSRHGGARSGLGIVVWWSYQGGYGVFVTVRAVRPILLLLAAVLVALGVSLPGETVATGPDEGAAVSQSVINAVPPMRDIGRLAADPTLLTVHSPTEVFALAPNSGPVLTLARLGEQDAGVTLVSRAAVLPVAGDRAPPVWTDV